MTRRYVVFAPGAFGGREAKTAHGVIAYSRDPVVAVVDPQHAGKRVRDVVPYLHSDAPIVATVRESLRFQPTALLIGIAPPGGALPDAYRAEIAIALQSRARVVNGLHAFLNDDAELRALADAHDSRIWDLRMPPAAPLFSGAAYDVTSRIVLTVGSDCAVGKMTAALELTQAAQSSRHRGGIRADGSDRDRDRRLGDGDRPRHRRLRQRRIGAARARRRPPHRARATASCSSKVKAGSRIPATRRSPSRCSTAARPTRWCSCTS